MIPIPGEIVDDFVQYLSNHPVSLKACSLVCRSWVSPSQKYIFNRFIVDVRDEQAAKRCNALLDTLTRSPHLPQYFRYVSLQLGQSPGPTQLSKLVHEEALHRILLLFPNVKSLFLWAFSFRARIDLPLTLMGSLQSLVSSPSFKNLRYTLWQFAPRFTDLIAVLRHCAKSLRSLELDSMRCSSASSAGSLVNVNQPVELSNLEQINISVVAEESYFDKDLLKIPNLQTFHRTVDLRGIRPFFPNILYPCIPNTVPNLMLTFEFGMDHENVLEVPNFGEYINMEHLKLVILEEEEPYMSPSVHRILCQFFSSIPRSALLHLKSITVEFTANLLTEFECGGLAWESLDATLARLRLGASELCNIVFVFKLWASNALEDCGRSDDEVLGRRVLDRIRERCRNLTAKGILETQLVHLGRLWM